MTQLERPTRVRHLVIASAWLMSALLYLDRFCISVAQSFIQEDLGLTSGQVGWMLSAFFWTYALGQVPSGWFSDRFGSRIMLTSYVLLWSLFTGLTGAAGSFAAVLLLRLGFGLAQAGAYPTAASIVSKWVPLHGRGLANGIIAVGGRVGGTLAMFATGYLLVWLTPASTPATLGPGDILNAPRLSSELTVRPSPPTDVSRLRQRSFELFSPAGQALVQQQAERYRQALASERARLEAAGKDPASASPQAAPPSPEDLAALAQELNRVIATPALFGAEDLTQLNVESEARRLARRDPDSLSERQSARLNRLVLEALHRESLKKLYIAGWRPMMWVYGSLGLIVAALIWQNCRNSPRDHPRCNAAEVELIEGVGGPLAPRGTKAAAVPLVPLLKSRSMWLCCLTQWFTNIGWVFLMTLTPRYFTNVHQVSIEEVGLLTAIPPIVGWFGMVAGGVVTDRLARRWGLRWGRALPLSMSRFLAMAAYLLCLFHPSPLVAALLFSVVAFGTDLGTASVWAFSQDVGGRNVGSILGWGNMWGNLGAAVTPPVLLWVVGEPERWNYAFLTCAAAFLLSGVAALGINATIPIAPNAEEPS